MTMTMTNHACNLRSTLTMARLPLLFIASSLSAGCIGGGPITYFAKGWEVACVEFEEHEPALPDTVCLWQSIPGGASTDNMRAACAQVRNDFYGENKIADDYEYAHIWQVSGKNRECLAMPVGELEAHPFPVTAIEAPAPEQANYITCIPLDEIEITDGDGSYQVFLESGRCVDPELSYAENCEELCLQWQASWPGYDEFTEGEDNGDCSVGNWSFVHDDDTECSAFTVPGSILASSATLSFDDALNSISVPGSGALIYDDTACTTGSTTCEPGLFFKVVAGTASYAYVDAASNTYGIALDNVRLGVLHEVQTQLQAASGALVLPDVEVYLTADDVWVNGTSFGPLDAHEFMEGATATHDPTNEVLVIEGDVGVSALGGAVLHVTIEADLGTSLAAWPWSAG